MRILVCGSRGKSYNKELVFKTLKAQGLKTADTIIEGCCPNSADVLAEEYAMAHSILIKHFPATEKNYLQRNVEMVNECDMVLAFFDGFSYGSSQTIAQGVMKRKKVLVIPV